MAHRARELQRRPPPPDRMVSSSTKRSFRSHSSSFEADDERSSSGDRESMGPEEAPRRRPVFRYAGEDTRLTSRKELAGWYAYGFAAEVFVICGMGMYQTTR
jgi:MFS transporter, UMF1 family